MLEYTRGRNPGTVSGHGAPGGIEVVERDTATVTNPGSTDWQTASITLGSTYDADTHSCAILLPSFTLNSGSSTIYQGIKYALNSGGAAIDLSIKILNTSGSIPITYEVFKVNGLSAAISRQQITKSLSTSFANNDFTISDPGGDYTKSRLRLNHVLFGGLSPDVDDATNYRTYQGGNPTLIRTSATNIRSYGEAGSASNYTFWFEIWPFG